MGVQRGISGENTRARARGKSRDVQLNVPTFNIDRKIRSHAKMFELRQVRAVLFEHLVDHLLNLGER